MTLPADGSRVRTKKSSAVPEFARERWSNLLDSLANAKRQIGFIERGYCVAMNETRSALELRGSMR